ncbi:hypothetical protein B296_00002779 [Ensete ventricosum]|uniref:Uncharacterized protein n=1 Tax=Ensete ventricosum TaxID=4639 RepID=A0A427A2V0_ENSVE|nr:hypothetical protein B296_00002779 [Ensete ventricosum]
MTPLEPASTVHSSVVAPPWLSPPPTAVIIALASNCLICHLQLATPSFSDVASVVAATHSYNYPPHSHILCHSPRPCTAIARQTPLLPSSSYASHIVVDCRHYHLQPHRCRPPLSLLTVALAATATTLSSSLPLPLTL